MGDGGFEQWSIEVTEYFGVTELSLSTVNLKLRPIRSPFSLAPGFAGERVGVRGQLEPRSYIDGP
jgi:hypothetical protein